MAVQALPAPVVLEDAEIKRLTRRTKILLAFFMIGFLGAEVYLLNTASFVRLVLLCPVCPVIEERC